GDDVAVTGVMLVAVGLVAAERDAWAGAAAGAAAAMKQLAWPLLPFVVAAAHARRRGARATAGMLGVLAASVVPFVVWNPSRFYDDVVRFPLGYGKPRTFHPTPAPGVLLARAFPHLRGVIGAVAALVIVGLLVWLLARRGAWPSSRVAVGAAAVVAAGGLLAPASRLGFVVYPASLLAWAVAARRPERARR